MIDVDMRADQILSVMQVNIGFCDVPHRRGRLRSGDLVSCYGYVFEVRSTIECSGFDRVWVKRHGDYGSAQP